MHHYIRHFMYVYNIIYNMHIIIAEKTTVYSTRRHVYLSHTYPPPPSRKHPCARRRTRRLIDFARTFVYIYIYRPRHTPRRRQGVGSDKTRLSLLAGPRKLLGMKIVSSPSHHPRRLQYTVSVSLYVPTPNGDVLLLD